MVELIVGTYGVLCWLLFKKFKLVPINTYTIVTAFLGGGVILLLLYIFLSVFHPVSHDGRMYSAVVQIVPNVRGTVIEVPIEANKPLKQGDVLFRVDPKPYEYVVEQKKAALAEAQQNVMQLKAAFDQAAAGTQRAVAQFKLAQQNYNQNF